MYKAVDHHSSTSAGIPNIALEADHVGMNKFHSPQDENYKLLVHEIRGMVEKIEKGQSHYLTLRQFERCIHDSN